MRNKSTHNTHTLSAEFHPLLRLTLAASSSSFDCYQFHFLTNVFRSLSNEQHLIVVALGVDPLVL